MGFVARKMDQGDFVRHKMEYECLFKQYFIIERSFCFSNFGIECLLLTLTL